MPDATGGPRRSRIQVGRLAGRPIGIAVLAGLLALGGLAALIESIELVVESSAAWPAALPSALIGAFLLHRAAGLWRFRHLPWLSTMLTLALKAVLSGLVIIDNQAVPTTWLALVLAVAGIAYLSRPRVRAFFARR